MSSEEFLQSTNPSRAARNPGQCEQEPWGGSELEGSDVELNSCFKPIKPWLRPEQPLSILPGQNPAGCMAEVSVALDHQQPVSSFDLLMVSLLLLAGNMSPLPLPLPALVAVLSVPEQVLGSGKELGLEHRDIAGMLSGKGSLVS